MKKIAVGITGASGAIYAKALLQALQKIEQIECCVVMSNNAKDVWKYELGNEDYQFKNIKQYAIQDYFSPIASGSSRYDAFVICPCSMGTLGRIANGISDNLITRAADVMLKEKRKLICVVRDAPYNLIHVQNMKTVIEAGGIICPASPSFYSLPQSIDELIMTIVERILNLLEIQTKAYQWGENFKP